MCDEDDTCSAKGKCSQERPRIRGAAEGGGAFVAERAEQLLRAAAATGLRTRAQCLEHLGRHFRGALDLPPRLSDLQARRPRARQTCRRPNLATKPSASRGEA